MEDGACPQRSGRPSAAQVGHQPDTSSSWAGPLSIHSGSPCSAEYQLLQGAATHFEHGVLQYRETNGNAGSEFEKMFQTRSPLKGAKLVM
jgi:hypothetical protein